MCDRKMIYGISQRKWKIEVRIDEGDGQTGWSDQDALKAPEHKRSDKV